MAGRSYSAAYFCAAYTHLGGLGAAQLRGPAPCHPHAHPSPPPPLVLLRLTGWYPSHLPQTSLTPQAMVCPICIATAIVANAPAVAAAAAAAAGAKVAADKASASRAAAAAPRAAAEAAKFHFAPPAGQTLKAEQRKPLAE